MLEEIIKAYNEAVFDSDRGRAPHTAIGENDCLKVQRILKERGLEDKIKIIVGGVPYRSDHELFK
ncbi:MAG: hypothetical protein ACYC64_11965 [Armatimonadota bacterium]